MISIINRAGTVQINACGDYVRLFENLFSKSKIAESRSLLTLGNR